MNKISTKKTVLLSLLSALCYIILYIKIPIPAPVGNPFLHFGNMFVLLFSLMFGGAIGGIAGSVGMGLYDLLNGYHLYAPKTIILKFLMGVTCSLVYAIANKKLSEKINAIVLALGVFFLAIGVAIHATYLATDGIIYIESIDVTLSFSSLLYIGAYILAVFMLIGYFFAKNKNDDYKCALFACTCGVFVNLVGEFSLGAVQYMIMTGTPLSASLILSAISLPATLLNGIISIIVGVNLFYFIKNKTNLLDSWKNI
ncbi:MAG: ECF transporter S component [Bacillota bacterium]